MKNAILVLLFFVIGVIFPNVASSDEAKFRAYPEHENFGMGLKRDPAKLKALKQGAKHFELTRDTEAVPGSFDLSGKVSPPENQGSCGSCWAFGITKALRSEYMLAGTDPGRLAFNYLVNNCGKVREYGCGGGDFDAGQNFLGGSGPWLESQDPYHERDGGRCLGLPVKGTAIEYLTVGPGNRPPTFQELAVAIYNKGQGHVLVIDGAVCGRWGGYSSGILSTSDCGPRDINHIINRVGYDCQTSVDSLGKCVFGSDGNTINHDGYFKDMNNWGSWGESGYIREKWMVDAFGDTAMFFNITQPPKPIDGGWSEYGAWSACIDNHQSRSRTCTNPVPSNGGKACIGPDSEIKACDGPVPPDGAGFPWITALIAFVIGLLSGAVVILFVKK